MTNFQILSFAITFYQNDISPNFNCVATQLCKVHILKNSNMTLNLIDSISCIANKKKKVKLMLTRRAKAYNSSCSQTVLAYCKLFSRS